MADTIKEGDVVQLNSGGPAMTAVSVEGGLTYCEWFLPNGEIREREFTTVSLKPYKPTPPLPLKG